MIKCRKSVMPECKYFTTGGCVSPFNCPYKYEQESITTATSTPLNPNVIYTTETYKDAEIARLTEENAKLTRKTRELETENARLKEEAEEQKSIAEHEHATQMDWFNTACEYKAENAELHARLDKAVELPVKLKDTVWFIDKTYREDKYKIRVGEVSMLQCLSNGVWKMRISTVICKEWGKSVFDDYCDKIGTKYFTDRSKAEAHLAELKGGKQ